MTRFFLILTFTLTLISSISWGQRVLPPTRKHFDKLVAKYDADTVKVGEFEVVNVRYEEKTYANQAEGEGELVFEHIAYLVENKYILKTLRELNLGEPDILFENTFSDIFLFPDSSLGILTYTIERPYTHYVCGMCSEEHLHFYRITKEKFQEILDIELAHHTTGYINLNGSNIFPYSNELEKFKDIRYFKDGKQITDYSELQGEFPIINLSWVEKGRQLKVLIKSTPPDTPVYANMRIVFKKTGDTYIWYWN